MSFMRSPYPSVSVIPKCQKNLLAEQHRQTISARLGPSKQTNLYAVRQTLARCSRSDVRRCSKRSHASRQQSMRRKAFCKIRIRTEQPVIDRRRYRDIGCERVGSRFAVHQICKTTKWSRISSISTKTVHRVPQSSSYGVNIFNILTP